jgi:hypothetical protein
MSESFEGNNVYTLENPLIINNLEDIAEVLQRNHVKPFDYVFFEDRDGKFNQISTVPEDFGTILDDHTRDKPLIYYKS